ncbi:TRAP transporter small permease [Celeribacter litoreus]|uniref:TRAP transporter small permease n=1 Tax=Celeribacter litoreus TaxID=2876714 RepID=UPI001CCC5A43|nr:TRAP transporter small permease [Celeribacter litoreus]MCA0044831.1 TRAP transporter small permease [Celeribacter litoreus]
MTGFNGTFAMPLRGLRFLVARVLPGLSAALILMMVAVTVVDVIGRYVFDSPLPGAFELTQILLADLVLAALPITTFKGSHVEVDLLSHLWSPRTNRLAGMFGASVMAIVFFVLSWNVGVHGLKLMEDGAVTNDLALPIWPAAALGALTYVLSGIVSLVHEDVRREF